MLSKILLRQEKLFLEEKMKADLIRRLCVVRYCTLDEIKEGREN